MLIKALNSQREREREREDSMCHQSLWFLSMQKLSWTILPHSSLSLFLISSVPSSPSASPYTPLCQPLYLIILHSERDYSQFPTLFTTCLLNSLIFSTSFDQIKRPKSQYYIFFFIILFLFPLPHC